MENTMQTETTTAGRFFVRGTKRTRQADSYAGALAMARRLADKYRATFQVESESDLLAVVSWRIAGLAEVAF